jgi:hypothetical protein
MITDGKIAWNRKRVFFPCRQMAGVLDDATSGIPASLGNGAPDFVEALAASELSGMRVDDEDEVYHFFPIPWDMDIGDPVRFRVWFVHTSTDADTPAFQVDYKGIGKQAAISDAKSSADESVTISAHTCSTTDNSLEITAWAESTSDLKIVGTDFAMLLALEVTDLGSASANEIVIMGLEMDYTVAAAPGPFRRVARDAVASPNGPNF